jgi:presenilin-like A22 family membrane protease
MNVKREKVKYLPLIGMAVFILLIQIFGMLMSGPFQSYGMQVFAEPESMVNPLLFIGIFLAFTALILLIIKLEREWPLRLFIMFAVALTMYYVFIALVPFALALFLTIAITLILYKYPEWYVIDAVAIIIGTGAASIFGISLGIVPTLILLSVLAIYDAISVYKTKHMVSLAEGVMDMKMPVLFIIPRNRGYSSLEESKLGEDAYFMGLGDAVIPTILVVSANLLPGSRMIGFISLPALGAMIGTFIGYLVLTFFIGKGKPQAGLPFLNSGAIIGFLVAMLI